MKNCSRAIALNSCEREARHPVQASDVPQRIDAALIDPAPSKAHINQAAKGAFIQAALPDVRLDFRDAVAE